MTNYTKKITNCSRDSNNTVLTISVSWTASKTITVNDEEVVIESSTPDLIGLQPPGENLIPFEEIDEETMISWYEDHIALPSMIYNSDGELVAEERTYYDNIVARLDSLLSQKEIDLMSQPEELITSGLPFEVTEE